MPPAPPKTDAIPTKSDKRATIETMLKRGSVRIHLDARRRGVEVPDENRRDPALVLRIGYNMAPPVPDLVVDGKGIQGSLAFHNRPFHCVVPWSALYAAIVDDEAKGMVWEPDVPPDLPK